MSKKSTLDTCAATRPARHLARSLTLFAMGFKVLAATAGGGPPMVTDDPETPGNGRWEVNISAVASRTQGQRELSLPDLDVNYGLGDRVQLKLDIPWVRVSQTGQPTRSGPGDADVGVKWRFYDDESSGVSVSTYPQYSRALTHGSIARGTASAGHEFFLPIEAAVEVSGVGLVGEFGKNFVQGHKGQWIAGVVATHACGESSECMAELRRTVGDAQHATLINFGVRHKFDESVSLLLAAGTERGTRSDERREALVFMGLQFTR